jgi:carbamoyl-phosphate synthase large subunit
MPSPRLLFSSLSGKLALYQAVFQQLKRFDPKSRILAVDSNPGCPASSKVEAFKVLPPLVELADENLIHFLQKENITHVLPTRDGELAYWSERSPSLAQLGVHVLCSHLDTIRHCEDKLAFGQTVTPPLLPVIPTFPSISATQSRRCVVKERRGSGSRSILLNLSPEDALQQHSAFDDPVFQPFIAGREFSAEGWVDGQGRCRAVLLRWRDKVVGGESHKSTTFHNSEWESVVSQLFTSLGGLRGHCLAQIIVGEGNSLHLVEINPRLGGASPLSLHAGFESILWSLQEAGFIGQFEPSFSPHFGVTLSKIKNEVFISYS